MEGRCPSAKELENYAYQSLFGGGVVENEFFRHINSCPRCQIVARKWDDQLLFDILSKPPEIEGYEVLELLGVGSVSKVYLAKHKNLGKHYAIKVIEPAHHDTEASQAQFTQQTQLLASIDHRNIVRLIDARIDGAGIRYLILQYVKGKTLNQLLPLPLRECYRLMRQMVLGMQEIHEHQLLLQEVKPSTFHVDEKNVLKIIDFGIAKGVHERTIQSSSESTNIGLPFSTYYYKSPEECLGYPLTVASDIYSLGATFYTLISGKPAFSDFQFPEILNQILNSPLPSLSLIRPEVPKAFSLLIEQMMAKNPNVRVALDEVFSSLDNLATKKTLKKPEGKTSYYSEELMGKVQYSSKSKSTKVLKLCSQCQTPQTNLVACQNCEQLVCPEHLQNKICEKCHAKEKKGLLSPQAFELFNFFRQHSKKEVALTIKGECQEPSLSKALKALDEDPVGGYLTLTTAERTLGLLVQSGEFRLFLFGKPWVRNLGQLLVDNQKISQELLAETGLNLAQDHLNEKALAVFLKEGEEISPFDFMQLISQELILMLASSACQFLYRGGKLPMERLPTDKAAMVRDDAVSLYTKKMAYFGHCLEALENPGTLIITSKDKKKIGIQLDGQRIKIILYQIKNEDKAAVWKDSVAELQLSFLESASQEAFIRDGETCLRKFSLKEKAEIEHTRQLLSEQVEWFSTQETIFFSYLQEAPSSTLQSKLETIELVADYRSLTLALLARISQPSQSLEMQEFLNQLSQAKNSKDAFELVSNFFPLKAKLAQYRKEIGVFETTLISLLELKLYLHSCFCYMKQMNQFLELMNHKESQKGLLEIAVLLFPDCTDFQEKLGTLYQNASSTQYL